MFFNCDLYFVIYIGAFLLYLYMCVDINFFLFGIHLLTCILVILIEQSWCRHSHMSTFSGG